MPGVGSTSFARGVEDAGRLPNLSTAVVARTGSTACARARTLLGAAFDEPLAAPDRTLVAGHLETCAACRAVAAALDEAATALPELAEVDPGPAFTARVLAATSRRPVVGRLSGPLARGVGRAREPAALRPRGRLRADARARSSPGATRSPAWERTVARVRAARSHARRWRRLPVLDQAIDARVGAWRDRAWRGAPPVDCSVTADARSWLDCARQAWDDAFGVAGAWMSRLIDGVETLASRIREWSVDLFASPTEPPAPAGAFPSVSSAARTR